MFSPAKSILTFGVLAGVFVGVLGFSNATYGGVNVTIDWDSTLAGVQSSINVSPNDTVKARIVFELDGATSLSGYTISTRFSTQSLAFVKRTDFDAGVLAVAGFDGDDVLNTFLIDPDVGNYGEFKNIAGFTLGAGPSTGTFFVSELEFTVLPTAVSGVVLSPGFFNLPPDELLDNNGLNVSAQATFLPKGSINVTAVPEPTTLVLSSIGFAVIGLRRLTQRWNDKKSV